MADSPTILEKVKDAANGNVDAFGDIVLEYQSSIRGFIAMLGVGRDSVEDVAQDTFIEAFRALNTYDVSRPFGPWLRGVARNRVRRWRSQADRSAQVVDEKTLEFLLNCEMDEDSGNDVETFRLEKLRQCLKTIPSRAAEIVRLKYHERKKSDDIARIMHAEPTAIRVTLGRIRIKLRECMDGLPVAEELP